MAVVAVVAVVALVGHVATSLVGDNGNGVGAGVFTSKSRDLGKGRVGGQAGWLFREHGGFALSAQGLLLGKRLLLPAHLASGSASGIAITAVF